MSKEKINSDNGEGETSLVCIFGVLQCIVFCSSEEKMRILVSETDFKMIKINIRNQPQLNYESRNMHVFKHFKDVDLFSWR